MNTTKLLTRISLSIALLLSPYLYAEPSLNGIAESIELNKERFIAALYTSNPSKNADDLLRNDGERRMELRITASRLSAKGLNNIWIEGMAINNPSNALREESQSLSKLVNMIRKSVVRGDTLVFDYKPGAGMTVTLNGVQLGNIASENFFSMVLRTWIGNVPLSSDFKEHLLAGGDVDDGLRDRFAQLSPAPDRVAAVEAWQNPLPAAEPAAPTAVVAAVAPPKPAVQISTPKPQIQIPASETIEALKRQNPDQVAASLPKPNNPQTTPAPATESTGVKTGQTTAANGGASQPAVNNQAAQTSQPAQVAQTEPQSPGAVKPATQQRPAVPPAVADEEEEEEALVSAEAIFDRQLYISNVLRKTWGAVKYPERALRREQEGTVRVTVTLDKNGKLLGTVPAEESRYDILNKEAIDSFNRAEPFEPFPGSITEEYISFTIPIKFEIQR